MDKMNMWFYTAGMVLAFASGMAWGMVLNAALRVKPLIDTIVNMKHRGFMPWAEISNTQPDSYPHVRED